MLKISETENVLKDHLAEAGLDLRKLDVLPTWNVFKAFVGEPVDSQSDGILVEYGTFPSQLHLANQTEIYAEVFLFAFTRQFQASGSEEYDQLRCQFYFEANDNLRAYGQSSESCFAEAGCNRVVFFAKIEASPVFEKVTRQFFPIKTEVAREQA